MAPANQQIVTAYEECGMSPEDIAQDLGFELSAVKMILLQHSQAFSDAALTRANDAETGKTVVVFNEDVFSKSDFAAATATMARLLDAEVESVRFKAAEYIINEVKGRNDVKALVSNNFNLVMVSETMRKAREAMNRARGKTLEAQLA